MPSPPKAWGRSRRSTSSSGRRLRRNEQPADQPGSLPEPLLLGGLCRGGEFSLDLGKQPRQRLGERDEGAVEIGGHHSSSRFGFRGHRQGPAGAGGSKRAVRRAGLFAPVSWP